MAKTYALIAANGRKLEWPLLSLKEAEKARDALASAGKTVFVVNVNAE
jgi:hypothetical protein